MFLMPCVLFTSLACASEAPKAVVAIMAQVLQQHEKETKLPETNSSTILATGVSSSSSDSSTASTPHYYYDYPGQRCLPNNLPLKFRCDPRV